MPDLDTVGLESHPKGAIIMWSGLLSNIPTKWQLADGTNGTADMTALFLRGSPPSTEAGTILGEDFHILTTGELPSHVHGTVNLGHTHNMHVNNTPPDTPGSGSTGRAGNTGAGTYDFNNENAGGSFGNVGSNQQHENRPPFFELAYIERVN